MSVSQAASRYIVVLKPAATVADIASLKAGLATPPKRTYTTALRGFAGMLSPAEQARLSADPRVDFIEPDLPAMLFAKPGGGGATPPPQKLPWGVNRIDAELNSNKGAGIRVAVIDTGVDLDHPDLTGVIDGVNYVQDGSPAEDDNGHGTHVSGTIAAADNAIGYVGVAPQAQIVAVKVLDRRGSGWVSDINAGIDWVAAHQSQLNIRVANMSLGASGYSGSMHTAIVNATAAGVVFVVAAGNSARDAAGYSPSGFDDTVITVSALDKDNTFAYYSNFGAVVDLIAPGTSVESLWKNGGYNTISGTSMASPHVAGAAALYLASNAGAGFSAVRSGLLAAASPAPAPDGWPEDPDNFNEPLVLASSL